MKKAILITLAAVMLMTNQSQAAFVVKRHCAQVAVETKPHETKKQSLLSKLLGQKKGSAEIPKLLYIILAIFPLGWLGMGINDNFEGWDWIISLLLYILGWLPGIIYTLIMMKKYY